MDSAPQLRASSVQTGQSVAFEPNTSKYVEYVKSLINRKMLIRIEDGRFFYGSFYCMDKQGNIILQEAVEYHSTSKTDPSSKEARGVGLILIPATARKSCHMECSMEERLALLSL